jgi:tetrahydromethanopterin S-methyltransferase subunit G
MGSESTAVHPPADSEVLVSSDFTGSNTEKIDKLVATIIELRTTLRFCFAIIGIGFPFMIGLLTFLVVQSFSTSSKVDRLSDQISMMKTDYERLSQRLEKIERPSRP